MEEKIKNKTSSVPHGNTPVRAREHQRLLQVSIGHNLDNVELKFQQRVKS